MSSSHHITFVIRHVTSCAKCGAFLLKFCCRATYIPEAGSGDTSGLTRGAPAANNRDDNLTDAGC